MRESKSGSSAVCATPDAPVVSSSRSPVSSDGSMAPSRAMGVAAGNGGGSARDGGGGKIQARLGQRGVRPLFAVIEADVVRRLERCNGLKLRCLAEILGGRSFGVD